MKKLAFTMECTGLNQIDNKKSQYEKTNFALSKFYPEFCVLFAHMAVARADARVALSLDMYDLPCKVSVNQCFRNT